CGPPRCSRPSSRWYCPWEVRNGNFSDQVMSMFSTRRQVLWQAFSFRARKMRVYDTVCKAWKGSIKYTGEVRDRLGAQVEGRTADGKSYQEGGDPAGIASGRGLRGQKPGEPPGGAQGPAWGTSFASLEELTAQVTELLG